MSRLRVGSGWSGRCAPACGFALAFDAADPDRFCPFDGGMLELPGVLGGDPSCASSSATRATSVSTCATSVSIRASSALINASFSKSSAPGVIRSLTHIPTVAATKKCNPHHPRVNQTRQKWREQLQLKRLRSCRLFREYLEG